MYIPFSEDPCAKCSDDATCEDGKCTCKEGFKGDGETCEGNRQILYVNSVFWSFYKPINS